MTREIGVDFGKQQRATETMSFDQKRPNQQICVLLSAPSASSTLGFLQLTSCLER